VGGRGEINLLEFIHQPRGGWRISHEGGSKCCSEFKASKPLREIALRKKRTEKNWGDYLEEECGGHLGRWGCTATKLSNKNYSAEPKDGVQERREWIDHEGPFETNRKVKHQSKDGFISNEIYQTRTERHLLCKKN